MTMEIDGKEEIENGKIKVGDELSIEEIFESKEVPSWVEQLTIRSVFVSILLGFLFTFIVMKLNVTTGVIPSLNVAAGLLGFFLVKVWTTTLSKFGIKSKPFTRQENTVIQTCVVATSGIAFSSGYGSYILGMTSNVASKEERFLLNNIKPLHILWMLGFLCVVSFVGLFSILPLRKIMILDYKLTYPSGTATAYLINSFHTPKGAKLAKKQVVELFKWFVISFGWAFFQWFYTAADGCGFSSFPTFGLEAFKYRFYFDFSATYVGVGMICPYSINLSMLFGAVLSWGIMWPLIEKQQGIWYPSTLPGSSLKGLQGYKVFIAIAMILGDGLYHFLFVLTKTAITLAKSRKKNLLPAGAADSSALQASMSYDDQRRTRYFLQDQIPTYVAVGGYIILAILAIFAVPALFHELKWYHIIIIYAIAPILAFCNSYGCGLTDWSLASSYGKLAIFIFGAWVGLENGGVVAGLAACGVMMSIVSVASDLMQDFKTGYLTLASPRSMFFSQVFGTLLGCILSPFVFWFFFYKAFPDLGLDGGEHPAPYGSLYRGIALIAIEGTSALPKNCLILSLSFFVLAIVLNGLRDILKYFENEYHKYVPSAMAMAIPFYLGGYFTIDMCVGSLIRFLWEKKDKSEADAFVPAMASGMICGDSLWGMPSSILSLAKVNPPLCMKFLSRAANTKVDALLTS